MKSDIDDPGKSPTGDVPSQARPRVLLVDDVEANLIALEAQLGDMECDLVRVSSGNDALRQLLGGEFAVMLLDVQMPDMDGYEVAKYARENPATRGIPIIFVTAMLETEDKVLRGYGTGAVDFLFKPINPYILKSKVQVFLELHNGRRRLADEVAAHKRTMAELEAFNYSVSHDLRAPLRPLAGFTQALLEDCGDKLDAQAKDYLVRIKTAAGRMAQLIDDLLRLSRIGRASLRMQVVDLSAVAASIVEDLRANDPNRNVKVVVEPNLVVQGDAGLLRIVFENLLRNAWKFTQKKPDPEIEVGVRRNSEGAAYFVRDNGVGFDPAFSARLFQPFQRLHTEADFEGTGIGLAIVHRIVSLHRGRTWADAVKGQGATLYFTLRAGEAR